MILQEKLACAETENISELDIGIRFGHHLIKQCIEIIQTVQRVIGQTCGEAPVLLIQPCALQFFIQGRRCPGAVFCHSAQYLQCRTPAGQTFHCPRRTRPMLKGPVPFALTAARFSVAEAAYFASRSFSRCTIRF